MWFGFMVLVSLVILVEGGFDLMLVLSDDNWCFWVCEYCYDVVIKDGVVYLCWMLWVDVEV